MRFIEGITGVDKEEDTPEPHVVKNALALSKWEYKIMLNSIDFCYTMFRAKRIAFDFGGICYEKGYGMFISYLYDSHTSKFCPHILKRP